MKRTPNLTALVAGIVLTAVGVGVLLDDAGRINLEFAYAGPSILAALGAILLVSGLASRRRGRG
jgi:divalent metal cation (Fe/Co/Zn/Cd) transporter